MSQGAPRALKWKEIATFRSPTNRHTSAINDQCSIAAETTELHFADKLKPVPKRLFALTLP